MSAPRRVFTPIKLLAFSSIAVLIFFGVLEGASRVAYHVGCGAEARREAYLRAAGANPPRTLEESYQRSLPMPYDPYLLWHLILNFRGQNLGVEVTHNSRGLRSPEIPLERPEGALRILLLGDSSVYGHGVPTGETWRDRLEVSLQALNPARVVQVINGGIPGYSSLQSLNLFRRVCRKYSPDLVVIANLWSDCIYDAFEDKTLIYGEGKDGAWARRGQQVDELLAERSAFYCAIKEKVMKVETPQGPPRQVRQPGASRPEAARARVSLSDYQDNLRAMAALTRSLGGRPVFAMLANRRDIGEKDDRQPSPAQYQPYRDAMRALALELNAPLVEMPTAFARAAQQGRTPLFLDLVHPTSEGNAVMTEALLEALGKGKGAR